MEPASEGPVILGRDIFVFLVELEIADIFGNPGTTEVPLVDGCSDYPSVRYVLSLREDIVCFPLPGQPMCTVRPTVLQSSHPKQIERELTPSRS